MHKLYRDRDHTGTGTSTMRYDTVLVRCVIWNMQSCFGPRVLMSTFLLAWSAMRTGSDRGAPRSAMARLATAVAATFATTTLAGE